MPPPAMESKVGLLIAVLQDRDVEDARSLRTHLGAGEDEVPDDWASGLPGGVDLRQRFAATAYAALAEKLTDRPELLARQIMALMDGLQIQWLRDPEATDLVQEWETAAEMLFAGFTTR